MRRAGLSASAELVQLSHKAAINIL